jgi:hypothetical protein
VAAQRASPARLCFSWGSSTRSKSSL